VLPALPHVNSAGQIVQSSTGTSATSGKSATRKHG